MNKIISIVFGVFFTIFFTQCKRHISDYSFEVNVPETVSNGWADRDSLAIPVELILKDYKIEDTEFSLTFMQVNKKGELFLDNAKIEEGRPFKITRTKFDLKFYAKKQGQYQLKLEFANSKGFSQKKDVFVNFGEADYSFKVEIVESPDDSMKYQGVINTYKLSVSAVVEDLSGYEIKFNDYFLDSISLDDNNISIEKGKYYSVKDAHSILVKVRKDKFSTNKADEGGFTYTVKSKKSNIEYTDAVYYQVKQNVFEVEGLEFANTMGMSPLKNNTISKEEDGYFNGESPCFNKPTKISPYYEVHQEFKFDPLDNPQTLVTRLNWKIKKKPMLSQTKKIKIHCANIVIKKSKEWIPSSQKLDKEKVKYLYSNGKEYCDIWVDVDDIINKTNTFIWIHTVLEDEFGNTAKSNIIISGKTVK